MSLLSFENYNRSFTTPIALEPAVRELPEVADRVEERLEAEIGLYSLGDFYLSISYS